MTGQAPSDFKGFSASLGVRLTYSRGRLHVLHGLTSFEQVSHDAHNLDGFVGL